MKKLKVLQVIHSLCVGGAEQVVVDLVENCNKDEIDMEVCCINLGGPYARSLLESGYKVHSIDQEIKHLSITTTIKELYQYIREVNPDVIHTHGDIALCDIGPLLLLPWFPPVIHTFHYGNYPNIPQRYMVAQAIFGRFVKQLVSVSDYQGETIKRYMKLPSRKLKTVFNGVVEHHNKNNEISREKFGLDDDIFLVGCIAVLTEQKGITFLLQAARKLIKKYDEIAFMIVGGGHLEDALRKEAEELGISEKVIFTGWREDARDFLDLFDLFVSPSLWEAFSIVILEAMAAGKAMVVTDVSDNSKVITNGETGCVVPAKQPEALAAAIERMKEDETARKAFGLAVREKYLEKYSIESMVRNYELEYVNLCR